jgi:hypothetical protein
LGTIVIQRSFGSDARQGNSSNDNGSRRNPNADFQEQFIGVAHSPPEISFIGKREKPEAELPKVLSVKPDAINLE